MILTYHSIDASGSPISVAPDVFRSHIRWLATSGQRVVRLNELSVLPDDADAMALTFDDGFANFAGIAAPLLLEAGLSATVFIVTDRVGLTNEWSAAADEGLPVLPLMAWDEIESLARAGIDIGAHTRSHLRLARVSDVKVLTDEIVGSGAEIESRIGVRPQSFAYPYGQLSDQAASIVRDNYERGCTTEMRALATGDDAARLPRLDAYYLRQPRILESWGTPRFARYIRARALGRRVRRAITVLAGA